MPSSTRITPAISADRLNPIPQCASTRWPSLMSSAAIRAIARSLIEIRQLPIVVVDGEVDEDAVIRNRGDTGVEPALEIDDDVDAVRADAVPFVDSRRDEQPAVVVDWEDFMGRLESYSEHVLDREAVAAVPRPRHWIFVRKYSMVLTSPSSSCTFGSQPRSVRARVMSGRRCFGSSVGSGL